MSRYSQLMQRIHAADRWIDRGVNVIGGCCGIEPRYIEQLVKLVEK